MNAIASTTYIRYRSERLLLATLIALCLSLFALYFYFLSMSVIHVVISKEISESMNETQGMIADLESSYMQKQHDISFEMVERHGYIASEKKIFINRNTDSVVTKR